ncbi:MAG: acetyl-CoA C-acyltransferase [Legionellales bacterium]|jgi:acetyl-CoA C-acetyltransferase
MNNDPVVIVSIARTPMGSFQGELSPYTGPQLGAAAIKAALARANLNADQISEVIMGCVLSAGQGQAPARQAALAAGLSNHTPCSTLNKMCGSGMKSVMLAHDLLLAHPNDVIIAGGLESMTHAPYLLPDARKGMRIGHGKVLDHMLLDGLEDAYDKGQAMGVFAQATADRYGFTREAQDEFAIRSVKRAQKAIQEGLFKAEITPLDNIDTDEGPSRAKIEKIPLLRPAFKTDGTVTAANSSSISDGAAALVLMRESYAKKLGLHPLAKIVDHAQYAHEPEWFTTAPVGAIKKLLSQINWTIDDVDLFEINEAFAVVTMAAIHDLKLDIEKVNIHGGACVLGHPIGASGARILVTLLSALQQHHLKRGIAALCIGGGEGTAMAIELV